MRKNVTMGSADNVSELAVPSTVTALLTPEHRFWIVTAGLAEQVTTFASDTFIPSNVSDYAVCRHAQYPRRHAMPQE